MGPRMRRRYNWLTLLRSFEHPAAQWSRHMRMQRGRDVWRDYARAGNASVRDVKDWEIT